MRALGGRIVVAVPVGLRGLSQCTSSSVHTLFLPFILLFIPGLVSLYFRVLVIIDDGDEAVHSYSQWCSSVEADSYECPPDFYSESVRTVRPRSAFVACS